MLQNTQCYTFSQADNLDGSTRNRASNENPFRGFSDGCVQPNPGPAATAFVLLDPNGQLVFELGEFIGDPFTNNYAEALALCRLVEYAATRKDCRWLLAHSDSQLIIRQVRGEFSARGDLADLADRTRGAARMLDRVEFRWVPREQNTLADQLSRTALSRNPQSSYIALKVVRWPDGLNRVRQLRGRYCPDAGKLWLVRREMLTGISKTDLLRSGLEVVDGDFYGGGGALMNEKKHDNANGTYDQEQTHSDETPNTNGASASHGKPDPLSAEHRRMLEASAISPEIIEQRRCRTVKNSAELKRSGFSAAQAGPGKGLLFPIWPVFEERLGYATRPIVGYQFRPDVPRINADGKPVKYETPKLWHMRLDCPPFCLPMLGNPKIPLLITEGIKKADAAASLGLCCIDVLGVWNWRGKNDLGGTTVLADWDYIELRSGRDVYIVFDSDVMLKPGPYKALARLKPILEGQRARVHLIYLPTSEHGQKVGLDDWIAEHKFRGVPDEQIRDRLFKFATDELIRPAAEQKKAETQDAVPVGKKGIPEDFSQSRLADTFERLHGAELRHVEKWKSWLHWNEKMWTRDADGTALDFAENIAREASQTGLNTGMRG
jgi:ribonuclease HI